MKSIKIYQLRKIVQCTAYTSMEDNYAMPLHEQTLSINKGASNITEFVLLDGNSKSIINTSDVYIFIIDIETSKTVIEQQLQYQDYSTQLADGSLRPSVRNGSYKKGVFICNLTDLQTESLEVGHQYKYGLYYVQNLDKIPLCLNTDQNTLGSVVVSPYRTEFLNNSITCSIFSKQIDPRFMNKNIVGIDDNITMANGWTMYIAQVFPKSINSIVRVLTSSFSGYIQVQGTLTQTIPDDQNQDAWSNLSVLYNSVNTRIIDLSDPVTNTSVIDLTIPGMYNFIRVVYYQDKTMTGVVSEVSYRL
jgi:hypothetical protein